MIKVGNVLDPQLYIDNALYVIVYSCGYHN